MSDTFTLGGGQAHETEQALARNGWTNALLKEACKGDFLAKVRQVLEGVATIILLPLLRQLATIAVGAVERFVVADHFKVDTSATAVVKIGYLGDSFKANFPAVTLVAHNLERASLDAPILAELGDRAETFLAYLWELLSKQPRGEAGFLPTDGTWSIFYIKDRRGKFWAVGAYWYARCGGWDVRALSVEDSLKWFAGYRVFSR